MRDRSLSPILDELATTLRGYFANQADVVAGYVFGSMAQGWARASSDVDVAVLLSDSLDGGTRFMRRLRLEAEVEDVIGRRTDLVVLNDAPPPLLQHQILKYGRLLFERDRAARVEFEVRAGKIYADLKPMYSFFTGVLFKEIKEVGLGGRRRHRTRATEVPTRRSGLPEE